jgi:FkbM family methyltransferase
MISRLRYYFSLIPVSWWQIKNRAEMLALLFGHNPRKPVLLRFRDGTQFRVRTAMDVWIVIETYLGHTYEQNAFQIQTHWQIIDICAGLGEFSVTAAKKCPSGAVYAYEPFSESFGLLRQNISLNQLGNVSAFPYALAGQAGEVYLKTSSGVPVLYSTAADHDLAGNDDEVVRAMTLDEVFERSEIKKCHLLKMDCEGAEYDIFFHASSPTLQKIERVSLEYHNGITEFTHLDLVSFFENQGFSVVLKPNPVHSHTGLLFACK